MFRKKTQMNFIKKGFLVGMRRKICSGNNFSRIRGYIHYYNANQEI